MQINGNSESNGEPVEVVSKGTKRSLTDDGDQPLKKAKLVETEAEVVDVEQASGAIVIDD